MSRGSVAVVSHPLPRRQRCVPSSSPPSARCSCALAGGRMGSVTATVPPSSGSTTRTRRAPTSGRPSSGTSPGSPPPSPSPWPTPAGPAGRCPTTGGCSGSPGLHELDAGHRGVATRTAWVTDDVTAVAVWEPPPARPAPLPLPADVPPPWPRAALSRRRPGSRRPRHRRPGRHRPAGRAALVAGPPGRPPDVRGGAWRPRSSPPALVRCDAEVRSPRPPSTAGPTRGSCAASASRSPSPPGRRTTSCRCGSWCGSLSPLVG